MIIGVVIAIVAIVIIAAVALSYKSAPTTTGGNGNNTSTQKTTTSQSSGSPLMTKSQAATLLGISGTNATYNATFKNATATRAELNASGTAPAGVVANATGEYMLLYEAPVSGGGSTGIIEVVLESTSASDAYSALMKSASKTENFTRTNLTASGLEYSYATLSYGTTLVGYKGNYAVVVEWGPASNVTASSVATIVAGDLS
jgi:hypothetical protein